MPILKVEGRIWHLAKKLNKPESWRDNADLRPFPEVKKMETDMVMLTSSAWAAEDVLVFGYRPYGLFVCVTGALVIGNAISWMLPFFIGRGDSFWFWFFSSHWLSVYRWFTTAFFLQAAVFWRLIASEAWCIFHDPFRGAISVCLGKTLIL